jgi:kumamolisin
MSQTHRLIPGSERREFAKSDLIGASHPKQRMAVTVVLTPDSKPLRKAAVIRMARRFGLDVQPRSVGVHSVGLVGTVAQMQRAFQVELHDHHGPDGVCRCRTGPVSAPASFGSNVVAVLGLDTRPQARAHYHAHAGARVPTNGYKATDIAAAYGFPPNAGKGHSVGIIELGGAYQPTAMAWYFRQCGIARTPNVGVNGTQRPSQTDASVEVMLDAEIIAALVPNARTMIYFAPNTTAGFYNAVARAVAAGHDAISVSWGACEQFWTHASMTAMNNLAKTAGTHGVTITAASGDAGSSDGVSGIEVDFPASAPYILGCGGTNLVMNGTAYGSETVWNANSGATGGGLSEFFPIPTYQSSVAGGRTMRMVPDVAANADPATGFMVRVNGQTRGVGGTSAASPLWAALVCKLNRALGRKVGFLQRALYALSPGSLRDIVSGTNGAYQAAVGYDLCTGLGSPSANLLNLLK